MPESEKRRRRPPVKRKIRCNKESPCSNCIRSKVPNGTCVYDNPNSTPTRRQPGSGIQPSQAQQPTLAPKLASVFQTPEGGSSISGQLGPSYLAQKSGPSLCRDDDVAKSTVPATSATTPSQSSRDTVKTRIAQLEEEILRLKRTASEDPSITSNSNPSPPCQRDICGEAAGASKGLVSISEFRSAIFGEARFTSRYIMHKRRLFGQSHWGSCLVLFRDLFEIFEGQDSLETASIISADISKCKEYARTIKANQAAPWPSLPTPDVPPRDVCDKLIDCYLRTTESVYRVIHIPSFMKDYTAFWESNAEPSMNTIVPLKLIMAIGATVFDRDFSLRSTAVRWIHQAEAWLCRPDYKARINLGTIQCQILLIFAREAVGLAWSHTWLSIGDLLRTAIYMGLHRDPSKMPRRTFLASELRRRIWNTILELVVRTSLTAGGPPLLSHDDFDTLLPGNFNDDQLIDDNPQPKPEEEFTQSSISRMMRSTFSARLTITKYLNDLGGKTSYPHTLQLENELRSVQKAVRHSIQTWQSKKTSSPFSPSSFQLSYLDMVFRRFLLSLHVPWFGPSLHDPTYAYSRRVAVETSIALWRITDEGSALSIDASHTDFVIISAYRTGFLHAGITQASHIQLAEISSQLREHEEVNLWTPINSDLLPVVEGASEWAFRVLKDGETNIKGYLIMVLLTSQIKAALEGTTADEMPDVVSKAIIEAKDRCLSLLEEEVVRSRTERMLSDTPPAVPAETCLEDWDLTIPDNDFPATPGFDPVGWIFDGSILQGPQFWSTLYQ
ncbi:unnamed protein product [Clonostachys rosea]|uniref:Xylanolytic transcriptional activator regulatory domain-containing protein n=1 Tax=Bionectria ochroleuca TaxID=29856 RepID=A0ABY6TXV0_BIOOC|nr:unnamed protein product [Clonostachys rosea]